MDARQHRGSSGQEVPADRVKVVVIGAGLGGIAMAYYLKQAGIEEFVLFEKADGVGGTWRENTYPGAGCDVPSHMYSYSFERHYPWAWRYGKQAEILAYARHCVDRHGIRPHIRFGAAVQAAAYDEAARRWRLELAGGAVCEAEILISAVGQLHRPLLPDIVGRERFLGPAFHSAHWNHDVDLTGKRVAVIGTGASAIQFVPAIADRVKRLTIYQRSPGWTAPKIEKRFSRTERWLLDHVPGLETLDRFRIFLVMESLAFAYNGHRWAERIARFISGMQLRLQVRDRGLRKRLTPDFPIGCKRILLTSEWYRTLTRPKVEVIGETIGEITENGVRTQDGALREADAIIYGTGFAATEFLTPMQVMGRDGLDLHASWVHGADAYLGAAVSGFPNFFMLYGPNTNLGSGSIIFMLECQSRYIAKLLALREAEGWSTIEVTKSAHAVYAAEMDRRGARTTYEGNCHSWYKTATGRNTNNWIGSCTEYRRRTRVPNLAHYTVTACGSAPDVADAA